MASSYSQDARVCQLSTPLGQDVLALVEFSGVEHVNDINVYHVRAVAENLIDQNSLMGEAMKVGILMPDSSRRYVNLICYTTRYLGRGPDGHIYEFELRPWFWMMNFKVNSRIFHDLSVKDILAEIFNEYPRVGGGDFNDKVMGLTETLEYTVQYRESDLNFCRRLMEEYGINFHVEMAEDSHTLVLTNDSDSFAAAPAGTVKFTPNDRAQYSDDIVLDSWNTSQQMASHSLRMTDYNYLTPDTNMETTKSRPFAHHASELEHYDHPGGYKNLGLGNPIAQRRLHALRTHDKIVHTEGRHAVFGAGMIFTLDEHDVDPAQEAKYIVLSSSTHFSGNAYSSGSGGGGGFQSSYVLTKEGNPVAPLQNTPRPRVVGPQTAVVVVGAETGDEYGRIKVRFHWEHDDRSMLARVSQMWAGSSWGTVFVPRVDMEVIVEFLDGNPDRPIITGCVYNANNMPPWDGVGEKEISGIKSQTMGGGGYNEISLNDKSGSEDIIVHAAKDMHTTIEACEFAQINQDSKRDVTGTETTTITGACVIESMNSIELKVAGSSIKLDATGIKITAIQIEVTASAKLATSGLLVEHKGGGTMKIQAPMITIN